MANSKSNMSRNFFEKFNRLFGRQPDKMVTSSPLLKYVDPASLFPASKLLRLGTDYGGWLIPLNAELTYADTCYLAGAGEDISFDCALAQRFHCKVRIVDPTPRAVRHFQDLQNAIREGRRFPINNSESEFYDINSADFANLNFLPVGLFDSDVELKFYLPKNPSHVSCSTVNLQKTEEYFTAQCYRLSTLMAQKGDSKIDLLKMDIEGAEYAVIRDLVKSSLLPRILLIEFDEAHTPLDDEAGSRIGDHIRQLVQVGMRCIAVDGCNATFVRTR